MPCRSAVAVTVCPSRVLSASPIWTPLGRGLARPESQEARPLGAMNRGVGTLEPGHGVCVGSGLGRKGLGSGLGAGALRKREFRVGGGWAAELGLSGQSCWSAGPHPLVLTRPRLVGSGPDLRSVVGGGVGEHAEVTQAGGQETFQDEAFGQHLRSERNKGGVEGGATAQGCLRRYF